MIVWDANFLISLSKSGSDESRVAGLLSSLGPKQVIGIPTPSWAEYLCGAGAATSALARAIQGHSSIRFFPFDQVAAIECAYIHQRIVAASGNKKGMSDADWQKIKIDRQILAISVVNRASAIYTNDINIIAEAQFLGVPTVRLEDVPLPPLQLNLLQASPDSDSGDPAAPPSDQL